MSLSNSHQEAMRLVEGMKEVYGNGVSSKIILYNGSSSVLTRTGTNHFWGKWQNEAPYEVSYKYLSFHAS